MTKWEYNQYKKCKDNANERCEICGRPGEIVHHVFYGPNRDKSTKYGMLAYLCVDCHNDVHHNPIIRRKLCAKAREKFKKEYPDLDFLKIFRRYY